MLVNAPVFLLVLRAVVRRAVFSTIVTATLAMQNSRNAFFQTDGDGATSHSGPAANCENHYWQEGSVYLRVGRFDYSESMHFQECFDFVMGIGRLRETADEENILSLSENA